MEKLLLHICCGPCSLYPVQALREKAIEPVGFFYNPNIHPFMEFERRVDALETVSNSLKFDLLWDPNGYGLEEWLAALKGETRHGRRCMICYGLRLNRAASKAKELGMNAFSTTLLYSRYQLHEAILEQGRECGRKHGIKFYYEDFRKGWSEGIETAKKMRIYRQPYCGCIFSEYERYEKRAGRLNQRFSESISSQGGATTA